MITDGDLRRAMESHSEKVFDLRVFEMCTKKPKSISMDASLETAYNQMSEQGVSSLVVLDKDNVVGLLKN